MIKTKKTIIKPKAPKALGSLSSKEKLKELSSILPEELKEKPKEAKEPLKEPQLKPEAIHATGVLSYVVCRGFDIYFTRVNKKPLSPEEKTLLSEPCNEIELRYLSPLVRGYVDKSSPFAKLVFEGSLIALSRADLKLPKEAKEPHKEDKPPEQAPTAQ